MIFLHKHALELCGTMLGLISSVFGMIYGAILTEDEWHAIKIAFLCGIAGGAGGLIVKAIVIVVKKLTNYLKSLFSGRRKKEVEAQANTSF